MQKLSLFFSWEYKILLKSPATIHRVSCRGATERSSFRKEGRKFRCAGSVDIDNQKGDVGVGGHEVDSNGIGDGEGAKAGEGVRGPRQ